MSEIAARYRRRADAFERTIADVPADRWSDPSPCAGWNARDVVDHVVSMHQVMLRRVGREPTTAPTVTEDPSGAFAAARADVAAVLEDPALARIESETPNGPMTVEREIDQVVGDDLVLHRWDLARATAQDDALDPEDVERLWATTTAIPAALMARYRTPASFGPGIEVYGPEVPVALDAPLQDRLLGLVGRDPARG